MIGAVFVRFDEVVEVRVTGNNVLFRNSTYPNFVPLDNLKFDYEGVIRQFPDLKDYADWKQEAIKRLKIHIKEMNGENFVLNYLISELTKHGYTCQLIQRQGHRPQKLGGKDERF